MQPSWISNYQPPTPLLWKGPSERRFHTAVVPLDLRKPLEVANETLPLVLLGFASDIGVQRVGGRPGASEGPLALRRALAPLPLQMPEGWQLHDAGDIVGNEDLESAQKKLGECVAYLSSRGYIPLVIGGGHELAFGHFLGLPKGMAFLNIDAHFDLRRGQNSGSSFFQIAEALLKEGEPLDYSVVGIQPLSNSRELFDTAKELSVRYLEAESMERVDAFLEPLLAGTKPIYLSLCLDVFQAAFAPGVSSPQPLGIFPQEGAKLLRKVAASGKLAAFSLAELAPSLDEGERTARLAASLLSTLIHAWQGLFFSDTKDNCC